MRKVERGSGAGRPEEGAVQMRAATTDLVMLTFRLNGIFLYVGDLIASPAGLTSARWQVLGAVLREPRTVSEIARVMGLTRQSVQRLANVLVDEGLAEYEENPRHRRAKLLRPTARGRSAIDILRPRQQSFADHASAVFEVEELREVTSRMNRLVEWLESNPWRPPRG